MPHNPSIPMQNRLARSEQMTEIEIIKRRIKLNRQALRLLDEEYRQKSAKRLLAIEKAWLHLLLVRLRGRLEQEQDSDLLDATVSHRLEAIKVLLNAIGRGSESV